MNNNNNYNNTIGGNSTKAAAVVCLPDSSVPSSPSSSSQNSATTSSTTGSIFSRFISEVAGSVTGKLTRSRSGSKRSVRTEQADSASEASFQSANVETEKTEKTIISNRQQSNTVVEVDISTEKKEREEDNDDGSGGERQPKTNQKPKTTSAEEQQRIVCELIRPLIEEIVVRVEKEIELKRATAARPQHHSQLKQSDPRVLRKMESQATIDNSEEQKPPLFANYDSSRSQYRFIRKSLENQNHVTLSRINYFDNETVETEFPRNLDDNIEILSREAENLEEKFNKTDEKKLLEYGPIYDPEQFEKQKKEKKEADESEDEPVCVSPCGRFFKYDKEVGRGSFKTVYRGLDTQTGVAVAWCELLVSKDLQKVDYK